jgi:hypothetical protein
MSPYPAVAEPNPGNETEARCGHRADYATRREGVIRDLVLTGS